MSNPALFYAIAAVSMSFAGFAGLYLALRPAGAAWEAYEVSQISTIILYALTTLFGALLIVPLADLIGEALALRVTSAALLVVVFYGHQVRLETSWTRWPKVRDDLSRRALIIEMAPFVLVAVAGQVVLLATVVAPKEGLYQLALILILATPALVFVTVVSRFGSSAQRLITSTAARESAVMLSAHLMSGPVLRLELATEQAGTRPGLPQYLVSSCVLAPRAAVAAVRRWLSGHPGFDPATECLDAVGGPSSVAWHRALFKAREDRLRVVRNVVPLPKIEVRNAQHRRPIPFPEQRLQVAFKAQAIIHLHPPQSTISTSHRPRR